MSPTQAEMKPGTGASAEGEGRARLRLDCLLVARGLAESREKAQRLIYAGAVRVDGRPAAKPGQTVPTRAQLAVDTPPRFVSRGGDKLEEAFRVFGLAVRGCVCLDVGASTGGFTDCLLQHGAARVYAVDVGAGQLHARLCADPRVVAMDRVNARYLTADRFPEPPRCAVVDVAFISLTKVLPAVNNVLAPGALLVTLIKPQFEAGRRDVTRGGVVRDPAVRARVVDAVRRFGETELGLRWEGVCPSPMRGPAGNIEYLAVWRTRDKP